MLCAIYKCIYNDKKTNGINLALCYLRFAIKHFNSNVLLIYHRNEIATKRRLAKQIQIAQILLERNLINNLPTNANKSAIL